DRAGGRRVRGRRHLAAGVQHQTDVWRHGGGDERQPAVLALAEAGGRRRCEGGGRLGQQRLGLGPPEEGAEGDRQDDDQGYGRASQESTPTTGRTPVGGRLLPDRHAPRSGAGRPASSWTSSPHSCVWPAGGSGGPSYSGRSN